MLTRSPISYSYFKDHFSHTIDFLNEATLTFNYDETPHQWSVLYSHYLSFIDFYKPKLQLSDEQTFLKKEGNSVTVSIVIVIIEHYKWKMSVNTDILKPNDRYGEDEAKNEYIHQYFQNQKEVYDRQLQYLTRNIIETISFQDRNITEIFKDKLNSKAWVERVDMITDAIRLIKWKPDKLEEYRDLLFGIDINTVNYSIELQQTDIWAFILFNLIFLEKRYSLFCSGERIITNKEAISDRCLIDKDTMIELYDHNNSWAIITCSLPFSTFNDFITNKEWFATLKKEIQKSYGELYAETTTFEEKLKKLTEYIEKQMKTFKKIEFYVGTKNNAISFIESTVTEADPKRYYETQQKLWTKIYKNEEWRRIFFKKTNIEDIEK